MLDDLDPATGFDAKVRNRAQAAIDQLKGILKKQGIQEGTEGYKERMAVGLYYLAALPDEETLRRLPSSPAYATLPMLVKKAFGMRELTKLGLGAFGYHIKIKGGFRVEENVSEEYTALEALKTGNGKSTERSKILFALLHMAGLNPQFVLVRRKGLLTSGDPDIAKSVKYWSAGILHLCIGLEMLGRLRLLDPSLWNSNPAYTEYFPLSLRKYLSLDYANRGGASNDKGEYDKAIAYCTRAIEIDPLLAEAFNNRGYAWAEKGEDDKAITDYTRALEIEPLLAEAYNNRGVAWTKKGEYDKAIADYIRAIEIDPRFAGAYGNLGLALVQTGKLEKALEPLAKFLKLSPQGANVLFPKLSSKSSDRWNRTTDAKKMVEMFAQETGGGDIAKVEAIFLLSYSLWAAGDRAEAIARFTTIADGLTFLQKPSKSTGDFFKTMFQLMPASMKKDDGIRNGLAKIKAAMN
ncbi:MAG: tetratricopeptide repeat protein [Deltaproteobacteria bacterium]|nr:tetratricopeptide repeat protein [Deltaproteobacteria bacterium]